MSKTWRYKLVVEFQAADFPAAAHFMDTLTDCMDVNMGVTVAELEKLQDWYDAQHRFRHDSGGQCGQCDLLLGEDMVLQEDGSYFCQDCDVSLEVG